MQKPLERHKYPFSPIWILPLVAFCIGIWLLYTSIRDDGINITVHFENAKGITPGKTKVIFKGIPIGTVKAINIDDNMEGVDLAIEMEHRAKPLLVEDTSFWIVKPEVSAGRISGLDTLFGGSYIGAQKGNSSNYKTHFQGLLSPPPLAPSTPGLRFSLEAERLHSLQRGSHIYAKNMQIGHIEDYQLQPDGKIIFSAFVKPEFSNLIKKETRFWNASGLSLTGNLRQGLTVNIESLSSLIYGGITCATHPSLEQSEQAEENSHFKLYQDFETAEYGIPMTLQLTTGDGIIAGKTEIKFRGLKIGVVKHLNINDDSFHSVTATVLLDPRAKVILRAQTKFWVVKPKIEITGIDNLETLVAGNYITFQPGEGKFQNHFIEEPDPLPMPINRAGSSYQLTAEDSGSLETGAPVLFKQLHVGEITDISLLKSGKVHISIFIYAPHNQLIRSQTVFWNVSGIQINGSLSNFKVNLASLQTMLAGGISFMNPPHNMKKVKKKLTSSADKKASYILYDSFNHAAEKNVSLQPAGIRISVITKTMPPLSVGSPVLYNNIKVGQVVDFNLNNKNKTIQVDLLIKEKYRQLVTSTSRFYDISGLQIEASLKGIQVSAGPVESILSGGISFYSTTEGTLVNDNHLFTLYDSLKDARHADDLRLTLNFPHGSGISPKTKITYQGIEIGQIESIDLDRNAKDIIATAYIMPKATSLFTNQSVLWLVKAEISFQGIKNPGTILTGPYIEVSPGKGPPQTTFTILEHPPGDHKIPSGLNIILETKRLGSLSIGSPVYFRQIKIGKVTGFFLSPSNRRVWININIMRPHVSLIYSGTKFWNSSGFRVSGSVLGGLTVASESVEALVKGGISIASPEGEALGMPAQEGDLFILEETVNKEWLNWQPTLPPPQKKGIAPATPKKPKGSEASGDKYL